MCEIMLLGAVLPPWQLERREDYSRSVFAIQAVSWN